MHARRPDGSLQARSPFEMPQEPEFFMGGGGLYSTGPDYLRFLRMLLGGGQLDGAQVLRPETVAEMGQNQIGDLNVGLLKTAMPGQLERRRVLPRHGQEVGPRLHDHHRGRRRPAAAPAAWPGPGLANTYYWIDPTRRVTGVILTQILPFADAAVLGVFDQFERAIYASLV